MYDRIEFTMKQHGGMPVIKGKDIQVEHILDLLAEGVSFTNIIDTYPGLEEEDCRQALNYSLEKAVEICENELAQEIVPVNK